MGRYNEIIRTGRERNYKGTAVDNSRKSVEAHFDRQLGLHYQSLSEEELIKNKSQIKWKIASAYCELSEDLIRRFSNTVHWPTISEYQNLSEDFIEEFSNKVEWASIAEYQNLSKQFINKRLDKLSLIGLSKNKYMTPSSRKIK